MTNVRQERTGHGFIFGAAEVMCMTEHDGNVCIDIRTDAGKAINIYVSPTGRSLRVFDPGAKEWSKP